MSRHVRHAWQLIQVLTVTSVLLVGTLPAESAVRPLSPSTESERAMTCTVQDIPQDRATHDRDVPPSGGPRVAVGEDTIDGGRAPRQDPRPSQVCPLHLDPKPAAPRGNQ
jgi:hypothetical protein